MHELYMDSEMYRERIEELEEWIVSLLVSEGCKFSPEMITQERFDEIRKKYGY